MAKLSHICIYFCLWVILRVQQPTPRGTMTRIRAVCPFFSWDTCFGIFFLRYLLWQSGLEAQVSSWTRYSFLAATNNSAQPFYSKWVFTHPLPLTITILPPHIFFSKMALSLEMRQDNNTGCNCTALDMEHTFFPPEGEFWWAFQVLWTEELSSL